MIFIRDATKSDAEVAAPLIYASGPEGSDYVFGPAQGLDATQFFQRAFSSGQGDFGFPMFRCAADNGLVVGVAAAHGAEGSLSRSLRTARQITGIYGLSSVGVLARGSKTARVTPPPTANEWYIAHVGVNPSARGQGIGSLLVRDHINRAKERGLSTVVLDVAVDNPAAQRLYERLGFVVTKERSSSLTNDHGTMPGHRRMAFHI